MQLFTNYIGGTGVIEYTACFFAVYVGQIRMLKKLYNNVHMIIWIILVFLFHNADKIRRRQLKEGHHADVMVSPVESVCSQISQIGHRGQQVYNSVSSPSSVDYFEQNKCR